MVVTSGQGMSPPLLLPDSYHLVDRQRGPSLQQLKGLSHLVLEGLCLLMTPYD